MACIAGDIARDAAMPFKCMNMMNLEYCIYELFYPLLVLLWSGLVSCRLCRPICIGMIFSMFVCVYMCTLYDTTGRLDLDYSLMQNHVNVLLCNNYSTVLQ